MPLDAIIAIAVSTLFAVFAFRASRGRAHARASRRTAKLIHDAGLARSSAEHDGG